MLKHDTKEDLESFFSDIQDMEVQRATFYKKIYKDSIAIQLWGFEVVLMPDGTYFLNDTSGG